MTFVTQQQSALIEFWDWWKMNNIQDPESFPNELQYEEDWAEQLELYQLEAIKRKQTWDPVKHRWTE